MKVRIGDKIRIVEMVGESDYSGRIGIVENIDSIKTFLFYIIFQI